MTKTTPAPKSYRSISDVKPGDVLTYKHKNPYFDAKPGAKAKVTHVDVEKGHVHVKWLDKKSNGQRDGAYHHDMFAEETVTSFRSIVESKFTR